MSLIMPKVHDDCCHNQLCIHILVPKCNDNPFQGTRVCIKTKDGYISALDFQERAGYTSLMRNRIPCEDRKIGTRQMVPILTRPATRKRTGASRGERDKEIAISSLRDVLYNISEKWLAENSDPAEWVGGKEAIDIWFCKHIEYLTDYPISNLTTFSRKLCYDNYQRLKEITGVVKKKKGNLPSYEEYDPKYAYTNDLDIRKSTIPNAGKGVFARVPMKKRQVIGRYSGNMITHAQLTKMSREQANKVISVTLDNEQVRYIDGSTSNHFSSFFNHKWMKEGNPKGAANLHVTSDCNIVCVRDIEAGEELFFDYGYGYWIWQILGKDTDKIKDAGVLAFLYKEVTEKLPN